MPSLSAIIQLLCQAGSLLFLFASNCIYILLTFPYFLLVNLAESVLHRFHDPRSPGQYSLFSKLGGPASANLTLEPVVFYEGVVTHVRRAPVKNEFKYNVRMAVVNLDNPPTWFKPSRNENMTAQEVRCPQYRLQALLVGFAGHEKTILIHGLEQRKFVVPFFSGWE